METIIIRSHVARSLNAESKLLVPDNKWLPLFRVVFSGLWTTNEYSNFHTVVGLPHRTNRFKLHQLSSSKYEGLIRKHFMYPTFSQFPNHVGLPTSAPKAPKPAGAGNSNPYKQVNQFLDFQIKQAKLRKLQDKNGKVWPPTLKSLTYEACSRS